MSVSPVSSAKSSPAADIAANPAGYVASSAKTSLDSSDFLKLLSAQMANQDPMEPMKDTAFISQMASFTSLAQVNTLTKQVTTMGNYQSLATATSYLGRTVTVQGADKDAAAVTGVVTKVDSSGSEPTILVDGTYYKLSQVQSVTSSTGTGS